MNDIVHAAAPTAHPLTTIPEWMWMECADEDEWDGTSLYLDHVWFPRMKFIATLSQNAGAFLELNFTNIGQIKSSQSDEEELRILTYHTDLLPKPAWYGPFYEKALELMANEANMSYFEDI